MINLGSVNRALTSLLMCCWAVAACQSSPPSQPAAFVSASSSARPRIVVLGDSLTAGYGLGREQAFPSLLQERLDREGLRFEVVNAGVSGDTSAGGLRRIDWVLEGEVRVLVLALGGNDGLRGLGVSEMKANLSAIIERARARGIAVLLAGMEAPPNLGAEYSLQFRQAFGELAAEHDVARMPFLLKDVAGVPDLNQPDGIHPNPAGARVIAENLWPHLRPLLDAESAQ
jgi:acyl-CoA thioesterase-1